MWLRCPHLNPILRKLGEGGAVLVYEAEQPNAPSVP